MKQKQNIITNAQLIPSAHNHAKPMLAEVNFVRPVRVQRKRIKGWKMPENTVSVCRPTKFGNPFKIVINKIYVRDRVNKNWIYVCDGDLDYVVWLYSLLFKADIQWVNYESLRYYHLYFQHWYDHFKNVDLSELKGKNLACFCSLKQACHVDFLLKKVNE